MKTLEVTIRRLEPMRMACTSGFGPSPEAIAMDQMHAFIKAKGIDPKTIRWFGFNNPSPSPGSPNYGYDVWITVGPEVSADDEVKILEFGGGLYAVTHCVGAFNLPEAWQQLVQWREDSPYQQAHHQWLEELHNFMETDPEKLVFDIYLPVEGGG